MSIKPEDVSMSVEAREEFDRALDEELLRDRWVSEVDEWLTGEEAAKDLRAILENEVWTARERDVVAQKIVAYLVSVPELRRA